MTTTEQNLADLAEVVITLAAADVGAPDPLDLDPLPDPLYCTRAELAAALAAHVGQALELVCPVEWYDNHDAADAAARVLIHAGAARVYCDSYGPGPGADLTVGDPVPGGVMVAAHEIYTRPGGAVALWQAHLDAAAELAARAAAAEG